MALTIDPVLEAKALELHLRYLFLPETLHEFVKGIDLLLLGIGGTNGQRLTLYRDGRLFGVPIFQLLHSPFSLPDVRMSV